MLVLLLIVLIFAFPSTVSASQPFKVDPKTPVRATDVEIGYKVQFKGTDKPAKPAKPASTAATGVLGTQMGNGDKYAIVIGISNYPGTANDLNYCDDDAMEMSQTLVSKYGFSSKNIILLLDLSATREAVVDAISAVKADAKAGDEVVFFYSGHGGRGKANDGDLEQTDECIWLHDGVRLQALWDGELAAEFSGWDTNRMIFIFDSCYAGGMTDLAAPGRVIAMASTENSLSAEYSTLENGEFTYWMIEQGMRFALADRFDNLPNKSDVTIEEAWDFAKANCKYDSATISDNFINDLLP